MLKNCLKLSVILAVMCYGGVQGSQDCQEKVADVVFVLDSSYSIWPSEFTIQLSFLQDLVESFTIGPNHIRVGVVTYSSTVRLDLALNEYSEKRELQQAIGQIQYMEGGTKTGDAIHFARTHMFTAENGGRPWAAHIIILITDGYSHDSDQTSWEGSAARSQGIQMVAVGVGGGVDERELRAIASYPDESHVFQVENYKALKQIEKALASQACHKANTTDPKPDDTDDTSDNPHDTATKRCGGKPADVYFLLDSSSSIWRPQFNDQLHFVAQLLHIFDLGPDQTRVGVAVYSDDVTEVVSLTDRQSRRSVKATLEKAPYLTGGTNTGHALEFVRKQGFAAARRGAAHVIIVVTDGQSANSTHTLQVAQRIREQGIYVFAVGVGSETDMDELMEIASDPDENFVFHVDQFEGLKNIRELLAIKTCDVDVPDHQGDQADDDCRVRQPTDVIFVYDFASVNRLESDAISDVIRYSVGKMDSDQDTVRFGLVRGNCFKGDNIDLKTGAKGDALLALLKKPHHQGLHMLLKKVRLHGYLTAYDNKRSRARKVVVLFAGSKMADSAAVEKELQRLRFQGVLVMTVAVDTARVNVDMLRKHSSVEPLQIDTHERLPHSTEAILEKFCEINRLKG